MDWAQVRALTADGVTQREIAARLGINRRTVARLAAADEPPRYARAAAGSMLDPLEAVLRKLVADFEDIKAPRVTELLREDYGYVGSVDLVRKRLAVLRPKAERPAQKTGYRPGQVLQVDWAEMPTRPTIAGRERRVYALICTLPFSGASTAHFTFDMTIESFLQGHVRAFEWLGGVPRECVYDNLRAAVARRERVDDRDVITWNQRFSQLRGHYAFHATACTPQTPREKGAVEGAVRYHKTGFWPARRFDTLTELDDVYARWRDGVALPRRHATGRHIVGTGLRSNAKRCVCCRPLISTRLAGAHRGCRSTATSSTAAASTALPRAWFISASSCAMTAMRCGSSIAARPSRASRAAISTASGSQRRGCAPSRRRSQC
jgi:transposase